MPIFDTCDFLETPLWAHELAESILGSLENRAPFPEGATGTGLPLTAPLLTTPPKLICNGRGELIRVDVLLYRCAQYTVRLHHWTTLGDMDRDPHNHPWSFVTYILRGGYTEVKTRPDGRVEEAVLRAGVRWSVKSNEYHQVKDVLPGTVTLIVTGPAAEGNAWGYLVDGKHVPFQESPHSEGFLEHFRELNWFLPVLNGAVQRVCGQRIHVS